MTCAHCLAAAADPYRGLADTACKGCTARRLALSPAAFQALAGEPDELRAAIQAVWKDDYKVGRAEVWKWIELINRARRT